MRITRVTHKASTAFIVIAAVVAVDVAACKQKIHFMPANVGNVFFTTFKQQLTVYTTMLSLIFMIRFTVEVCLDKQI